MMKHYWISAYDDWGNQFGASIEAENDNDMEVKFKLENPHGNIADYGAWEDME